MMYWYGNGMNGWGYAVVRHLARPAARRCAQCELSTRSLEAGWSRAWRADGDGLRSAGTFDPVPV